MRKEQQAVNEETPEEGTGHDVEPTQVLHHRSERRQTAIVKSTAAGALSNEEAAPKQAKLPTHSRAAAAQRLSEVPEQPVRGTYYPVPHRLLQPPGWRTKRYLKRKNLRLSNLRYASVDRKSVAAMMPIAVGTMGVLLVVSIVLLTVSAFYSATQQRFNEGVVQLEDLIPRDNIKLYSANGQEYYQLLDAGQQTSVPLAKISKHIINAEIAIEDQNFWDNPGYDITGILRAVIDDVTKGHVVSGGSTITQQLIKNNIVGNQPTVVRKFEELLLAPSISRYYTKERILEMYLNTTYYGEQAYGIEAAAFTYFGLKANKDKTGAEQLTAAQAATIAGIPSSPIARDPLLHPKASQERTQDVLKQMYQQKYINHDEYMQALDDIKQPDFLKPGSFKFNPLWVHYAQYTLRELSNALHVKPSDLSRSGLKIQTALDMDLQTQVLSIAQKHIAKNAAIHHMSNAAVVVIDPHTGAVRTIVGNIDPASPKDGAFDVATQGFRQPGSSFKPFIYVTGFKQGISPGTPVLDAPLTIQMCCGLPSYSPVNYDGGYHGLITYRYALQNSFNIPAVKLLMNVGVDNALKTAEELGMGPYVGTPNYTMVLGSLGVHLLDMTSAYATFANEGVHIPPHAVVKVTDIKGNIIYQPQIEGQRILSKQTAYMLSHVLSDNDSRTFEFGKCSALYLYSTTEQQCYAGSPGTIRPAAAKTGTSNDFRDNWTIGYTPDMVVGVWAGNNDNSPMHNVTGVDGAAPIWHETLLLASKDLGVKQFANPGGLVWKTVNYPGKTTTDWYLDSK
jgi:penicillin-binding protein 1A